MAIRSDFFVATPAEVGSMNIDRSPAGVFPTIQTSRIEVVKIVQLQTVIDGSNFDDHLPTLDSLFVRQASDDGPWIIQIPSPIFDALTELDAAGLLELASKWATTEEWELDGGTEENLLPLVEDLAKLAQLANENDLKLYIWISI